jgi:hypothetical protein
MFAIDVLYILYKLIYAKSQLARSNYTVTISEGGGLLLEVDS